MEKAFHSLQDAYEVMMYAETGEWPIATEEELERKQEFLRSFPELDKIIDILDGNRLPPKDERFLNSFANAFTAWGWNV